MYPKHSQTFPILLLLLRHCLLILLPLLRVATWTRDVPGTLIFGTGSTQTGKTNASHIGAWTLGSVAPATAEAGSFATLSFLDGVHPEHTTRINSHSVHEEDGPLIPLDSLDRVHMATTRNTQAPAEPCRGGGVLATPPPPSCSWWTEQMEGSVRGSVRNEHSALQALAGGQTAGDRIRWGGEGSGCRV
jgi:hypothetical protein